MGECHTFSSSSRAPSSSWAFPTAWLPSPLGVCSLAASASPEPALRALHLQVHGSYTAEAPLSSSGVVEQTAEWACSRQHRIASLHIWAR